MSSVDENSPVASNSSSDSSNFTEEFDEWEERVFQQNRQIDRIIEDMILSNLNRIVEDQTRRARRRHRNRERRKINKERLMNDYFVDRPTYTSEIFRRRFRMQKSVFLRIVEAITVNDEYFQQRPRQGLSALQKCTGAMRVLAYGTSSDVVDEYLRMSATVMKEALMHFVEGVISCFGDEYLRRPNEQDLARLLNVGDQRGFPGSRNNIDALHRSPFFSDVLEGEAPNVSHVVNGRQNDKTYYLTDGIYPSWAVFVKSIICPQIRKHKLFAQHQETIRKDAERAFEVLLARFTFLRHPYLIWDKLLLGKIVMACIIMHNMIVEDELDTYQNYDDPTEFLIAIPARVQAEDAEYFPYSTKRIANLSAYMTNRDQIHNREAHSALKYELIEHIWEKFNTSS